MLLCVALASHGLADSALLASRLARHASAGVRHASPIACDEAPLEWALRQLRALRVPELKSRLSAAGISTANMIEKEELVTALHAAQPSPPPPFHEAPLSEEEGGGLYVEATNRQGDTLRLMVDTGAARSVLSAGRHAKDCPSLDRPGKLDCPSLGLVGLECAIAALPSCAAASTSADPPSG